jgi:hypothetical protein
VDTWRRFPEISVRTLITAAETQFASAFGGLIYIEVPETTKVADFSAEISGGVLAPRFVKGKTTLQEWRDTVRNYPAPWGEVETSKMIVTTQTAVLRNLDDPSAVADAWDRVLDATADLATIPRERTSPERFVCDEQISAGGMHSGYPLMCHLDSRSKLIEAAYITGIFNSELQNSWGFFHEIGHNHQNGDWTFDGTGEVTVNLFPLHTFEVVGREPVAENARGSLAFRQMQMRKFNFVRPDFELWKSDPFLALTMYVQLQQAFGWGAYKAVFAEYLALEAAEPRLTELDSRAGDGDLGVGADDLHRAGHEHLRLLCHVIGHDHVELDALFPEEALLLGDENVPVIGRRSRIDVGERARRLRLCGDGACNRASQHGESGEK